MAPRKSAPGAPSASASAAPDAPPVPFAVDIVATGIIAHVACRTEEEALSVIGFVASARQGQRMVLLPATAWAEGRDAEHILIDAVGASAWMVRDVPAYGVPGRVLAALEALPPAPAPADASAPAPAPAPEGE